MVDGGCGGFDCGGGYGVGVRVGLTEEGKKERKQWGVRFLGLGLEKERERFWTEKDPTALNSACSSISLFRLKSAAREIPLCILELMESKQAKPGLLCNPEASQRTLYPYVTGTSVAALKYKDGILMADDMGGSYGSTLRYKSVERMKPIGKHSLLGASGEISDFQELLRYLDELSLYDNMWDDGNSLGPKEVHNYLTRVMYNRRNKFNPLWNSLILGGVKKGQASMIGVNFEDNHVATGFGNHLARPILRDEWHENLTFEEGVKLLEKCMRVLLYCDRSAVNKLQISKITEEGVTISQPYSLKTFWVSLLSKIQHWVLKDHGS
ncbi:unnamed protein product [Prunus armeniaca]|uniref:Proteasome subunit beta n=1 Tax=Prunus armeniaca TaxID=36596 RepID=A0A6J5XGT0_PRUAR|nr:unnamed protein product [Prunus armeniaca]